MATVFQHIKFRWKISFYDQILFFSSAILLKIKLDTQPTVLLKVESMHDFTWTDSNAVTWQLWIVKWTYGCTFLRIHLTQLTSTLKRVAALPGKDTYRYG